MTGRCYEELVLGAGRGAIVRQFRIESAVCVAAAVLLAVALMEWTLPYINAFLNTGARLDYRHEPGFALAAVFAALAVGWMALR